MKLTIEEARVLAERSMVAVGHTQEEAQIIADHLIDCELRGVEFGGLARALSIIEHITETTPARRPITITRETSSSASIDGGDQVGYLVANRATSLAIEKARVTGLAVVGARETWYTGMFSYYLEKITKAGFAGIIAGSGPPLVAPYGGTEGRFATNPIAFGFPSASTPIICDIGTSNVMYGEVMLARRLGTSLPQGSAFDSEGNPTEDPAEALNGALAVWGGHKGSGLALVVQLLGMMCGAATAPPGLRDCGFFLLVFDPGLLTCSDDYKRRVAEYANSLRATRPLEPGNPVRVPLQRSAAERAERLAAGTIEIPDQVHEALNMVSAGHGSDPARITERSR